MPQFEPYPDVCVTLRRPRGMSGSMPFARDSASTSSCPGTTRVKGDSHAGSATSGSTAWQAAAKASSPPMP